MPRPHRCRFIDSYPDHWSFAALDDPSRDTVIMSLDEYETIRLLDKEGLKQEECAEKMAADFKKAAEAQQLNMAYLISHCKELRSRL